MWAMATSFCRQTTTFTGLFQGEFTRRIMQRGYHALMLYRWNRWLGFHWFLDVSCFFQSNGLDVFYPWDFVTAPQFCISFVGTCFQSCRTKVVSATSGASWCLFRFCAWEDVHNFGLFVLRQELILPVRTLEDTTTQQMLERGSQDTPGPSLKNRNYTLDINVDRCR